LFIEEEKVEGTVRVDGRVGKEREVVEYAVIGNGWEKKQMRRKYLEIIVVKNYVE
tara:strand:- start:706 stop:870 length:165 start_codon:yes stop_codon:yes gene_type:complete